MAVIICTLLLVVLPDACTHLAADRGGTMIEAWTPNKTLSESCRNSVGGPPAVAPQGNGGLYNGMVAPYLNMTIMGAM
eukprot:SAG31_NODE_42035_length_273_cov_0.885057_1_plen_78_part_10